MGYQRLSQTCKTEGNSQPLGERSAKYTPHPIEELQGLIGNRAMGRILQAQRMSQESERLGDSALVRGIAPLSQGSTLRKPLFRGLSHEWEAEQARQGTLVQAKLMVGKADDRFEEEAERVAAQVVQQIDGQTPQPLSQGETVQREEMEEERLQRKQSVASLSIVEGGIAAPRELEASIQGARGSGQPLAESVREPMEREFGAEFSGVRVHTDAKSDALNQSLSSRAFTTGEDIFFRQGEYEPENRKELIAHELTHVVQQKPGRRLHNIEGKGKRKDRLGQAEQGEIKIREREEETAYCPSVQRQIIINEEKKSLPDLKAVLEFDKLSPDEQDKRTDALHYLSNMHQKYKDMEEFKEKFITQYKTLNLERHIRGDGSIVVAIESEFKELTQLGEYLYRAMTKDEYEQFVKDKGFKQKKQYGGLVGNPRYSSAIIGSKVRDTDNYYTHLIEFEITNKLLKEELEKKKKKGETVKSISALLPREKKNYPEFIENLSLGLGETGTENVDAEMFNSWMRNGYITWKLLKFIYKKGKI